MCMVMRSISTTRPSTIFVASERVAPDAPLSERAAASGCEVVAFVSNDIGHALQMFKYMSIVPAAFVQLCAGMTVLLLYLRTAALLGLVFLAAFVKGAGALSSSARRLTQLKTAVSDRRLGLLRQIFEGIKAVKFYAWEERYEAAVAERLAGWKGMEDELRQMVKGKRSVKE